EQRVLARAELLVEILDEFQSLGCRGGLLGQRSRDLLGQSTNGIGSRPHGDRRRAGKYRTLLHRQFGLQTSAHDRRLPTSRSTDDRRKRPFLHTTAEFLDLIVAP